MTTQAIAPTASQGELARRKESVGPVVTLAVGLVVALAFTSAVAVALAVMVAMTHAVLETPAMQARRARNAARRQWRKHRERRTGQLEEANAASVSFELDELSDIVEAALDHHAGEAQRLELFLDRYVELAVARQRCLETLSRMDPPRLEARLMLARDTHQNTGVLERRVAQARALALYSQQLHDAITELADLIRYCGERARLSGDLASLLDEDPVATTLAEYDAGDALEREITSRCAT